MKQKDTEKSLDSEYENGVNTLNNSIINPLNMQITSIGDQNIILLKNDNKNFQENGTNRYMTANTSMQFNETFFEHQLE